MEKTEYQLQLEAELEAAKAEAAAARKEAEAARAELAKNAEAAKRAGQVAGEYRGRRFADNHFRVRDQRGVIHQTEPLIEAANAGSADAQALLDWLINLNYPYFTQVTDGAEAPAPAAKKRK